MQEGGPPCDFPGLPLRLDYARGLRGLEWVGSEGEVRLRPRPIYQSRNRAGATDFKNVNLHPRTGLGFRQLRTETPFRARTMSNPARISILSFCQETKRLSGGAVEGQRRRGSSKHSYRLWDQDLPTRMLRLRFLCWSSACTSGRGSPLRWNRGYLLFLGVGEGPG